MSKNIEIFHTEYQARPGAVIDECLEELWKKTHSLEPGQKISLIHNSRRWTIEHGYAND